ncbi:hypothetical protein FQ185_07170 [Pseudomonas sp. ANT_H12B]|nr:hypothetical protein FQ185_07170 [Pseudomonas sp. ANT_H12B]
MRRYLLPDIFVYGGCAWDTFGVCRVPLTGRLTHVQLPPIRLAAKRVGVSFFRRNSNHVQISPTPRQLQRRPDAVHRHRSPRFRSV